MAATVAEQLSCGPYIAQNRREGDVSQFGPVGKERGKDISIKNIKEDGRSLETSHVGTLINGNSKVKGMKTESLAEKPKNKKKDKQLIFNGHDSTSVAHRHETFTETPESNSNTASTSELGLVRKKKRRKKKSKKTHEQHLCR